MTHLRGTVAAGLAAFLALAAAEPLGAQVEGTDILYIEYQSLKIREDGKKRTIELKAKSSVLPAGCKVEFLLTWRYQIIERYEVEFPADGRIEQEFVVKSYVPSPEPYALHTQILEPKLQPKAVRKVMEEDTKTFPPGSVPWAEYHLEHQFRLGSEAEISAELDRIKTWFRERYTALGRLDVLADTNADAASAGTDFADSKGEFDPKKWRKSFDSDILKPIQELQKEIKDGLEGKHGDLVAYKRPLAELRELSSAVGWRAVDRSIELYKAKGLEPATEDTEPKDLSIAVRGYKRSPPKSADLAKMVKRIDDAIDPPKIETPPVSSPPEPGTPAPAPPAPPAPAPPQPPKAGSP